MPSPTVSLPSSIARLYFAAVVASQIELVDGLQAPFAAPALKRVGIAANTSLTFVASGFAIEASLTQPRVEWVNGTADI